MVNAKKIDKLTDMIQQELAHLCSDKKMIATILARMKSFIAILDYDLSFDMDITGLDENTVLAMTPAIQDLETRFDNVITEVIAERLLYEIKCYQA